MVSKKDVIESLDLGLAFLSSMEYVEENGIGLFERWQITGNKKSALVRPDCTAEYGQLLMYLVKNRLYHGSSIKQKCVELVRWCAHSVTENGCPFGFNVENKDWESDFWVNDNAKILITLIHFLQAFEESPVIIHVKSAIQRIANFLLDAREDDGGFKACLTKSGEWLPPFVTATTWGALALAYIYQYTGDSHYLERLYQSLHWLYTRMHQNGRMTTTYEMYKGQAFRENWRPPSSESAEFSILAAHIYEQLKFEESFEHLEKVFSWLSRLQAQNGAVRNCDEDSRKASEQNNPDLADFVYTNGYALLGSLAACKATSSDKYLFFAKKLGAFLVNTQVREDVPWKGSWRGSYDVIKEEWAGRAFFGDNPEEEGGMYSVYTGWTTAPILLGLSQLYQYLINFIGSSVMKLKYFFQFKIVLILPAVIILLVFTVYPFIINIFYSLHNLTVYNFYDPPFVGLRNYLKILKSTDVLTAKNTMMYVTKAQYL